MFFGGIHQLEYHDLNVFNNLYRYYLEGGYNMVNNARTVSPKDFGAVGNGIADDTKAFKNMFASGAKRFYITQGTYMINQELKVPTGSYIYGEDIDNTILKNGTKQPVYAATLNFLNCSNATIYNLTLDGNIDNVPGDINQGVLNMRIQNATNIIVRNVRFANNKYLGCNLVNSKNVTYDSCYFDNIDSGINGTNGTTTDGVTITNCVFDGHDYSEPIALLNAKNIYVTNCTMKNKIYGHAMAFLGCQNVQVKNCSIYNCTKTFYLTSSKNVRNQGITIADCTFEACESGEIANSDNVKISNCTFQDSIITIDNSKNVEFSDSKFIAKSLPCMIAFAGSISRDIKFTSNTIDNTSGLNYGNSFLSVYNVIISNITFKSNKFINAILYNRSFVPGSSIIFSCNYDQNGKLYTVYKPYVKNVNYGC